VPGSGSSGAASSRQQRPQRPGAPPRQGQSLGGDALRYRPLIELDELSVTKRHDARPSKTPSCKNAPSDARIPHSPFVHASFFFSSAIFGC
jgi:hypothetical protein